MQRFWAATPMPGNREWWLLEELVWQFKLLEARMHYLKAILAASTLAIAVTGCSTWDRLGEREKGTAIGAGAGAAGGAILSGGSVAGTAAGGVIGGAVGNEVGRRQKDKD
jgi:osmotically inducible lipoprotein OsmB